MQSKNQNYTYVVFYSNKYHVYVKFHDLDILVKIMLFALSEGK